MNGLNSARIFMCTWEFSVWTTIIGHVCVIHDSRRFIFLVRGRFWWNIFVRNFPWEIQSFFPLIIVFFLVECESVVHCRCYLVNLKFKKINWIKNHLWILCGWILFEKISSQIDHRLVNACFKYFMYILAIDYVIVRDSVDKINEFFDPLNFKLEDLFHCRTKLNER